jgi:enoyl-CoA hydratase
LDELIDTALGAGRLLQINRPHVKNALAISTLQAISEAIDRALKEGARALVLTGSGDVFCSGADMSQIDISAASATESASTIKDTASDRARQFALAFQALCAKLADCPVPVIAAMQGPALGGGATLAFFSDLRLATDSCRIGIPAAKLGVVLSDFLVRRIVATCGPLVASELLLVGRVLDADQALRRGLLLDVFSSRDELMEETSRIVEAISACDSSVVGVHKRAILSSLGYAVDG